jgi:hypothetical protein
VYTLPSEKESISTTQPSAARSVSTYVERPAVLDASGRADLPALWIPSISGLTRESEVGVGQVAAWLVQRQHDLPEPHRREQAEVQRVGHVDEERALTRGVQVDQGDGLHQRLAPAGQASCHG